MIDVERLPYHGSGDDAPPLSIAPPVPAPYLAGAPELPRELLTAANMLPEMPPPLEDAVTAHLYSLAAELRFRREQYENKHGVEIVPHLGSDRSTCPAGVF